MYIELDPQVALGLETAVAQAKGQEFSGLGFVERRKHSLYVYDVVILDIGSEVYTEAQPEDIVKLMQREDRDNMRLWFHRHPIGTNVPGQHNWSGTDEGTIQTSPLGGVPELVGWSCSIVRTPFCWVGRIDNHKAKKTTHVPVVGQATWVHDRMAVLWGNWSARQQAQYISSTPGTAYTGSWGAFDDGAEFYSAPIREDYATDLEYVEAVAEECDCELSELEIDPLGKIWLGNLVVGRDVDPDFSLIDPHGDEEDEFDVTVSEDQPWWKVW